jgi:hypothetical protein
VLGAIQHARYADSIGLSACLIGPGGDCGQLAQAFHERFGGLPGAFTLLIATPMLAGLFLGAPLIGREVETGTHRLAWTQSVTSAAAVGAVVLSLAFTSWMNVVDRLSQAGYTDMNRLNPVAFDLTGLAPLGASLYAFALGTAAGAVVRRVVPAMAITLGGYFGLALPLQSLRYHIFTPMSVSGGYGTTPVVEPGAYTMANSYADAAGHPVPFSALMQACGTPQKDGGVAMTVNCMAEKGFQFTQIYQPAGRYWPLQLIEFGTYGVLAAVLLGVALWWTTRRIS